MSNWVTIEIPRNANNPDSAIIGVAIFDTSIPLPNGSTFLDPSWENFVGVYSTYDPLDTNFDGEVSFGERLVGSVLPENVANSSFLYEAYTYLGLESISPNFRQLANGNMISMMADLTEAGVEISYGKRAFGISKGLLDDFLDVVADTAASELLDAFDGDYVPQFYVREGREGIVVPHLGSFEADSTPTDYDVDFQTTSSFSGRSTGTSYVVFVPDEEASSSLSTGNGNDALVGNSGNDNLSAGLGHDVLLGGLGDDALNAGSGDDYVDGGAGDDRIYADDGRDTIIGGAGHDYLQYDRRDLTDGETLSLDLTTGAAFTLSDGTEVSGIEEMQLTLGGGTHDISMVMGADVNNYITISSDTDVDHFTADFSEFDVGVSWRNPFNSSSTAYVATLIGQADDYLTRANNFERFTVIGGSAGDQLNGNNNNDRLEGRSGDDTLNARGGDDYIDGGEGDDRIYADDGDDTVVSASGSDAIYAAAGSDTIHLSGNTYHTSGYVAFNVSSDTQVGTQARINLEGLVRVEAVTDGGADADIVQLSDEGDAFFLHDAYSGFHNSVTLTEDYVGNESAARFANIEEVRGMGGDDIIDLTSPDYSLAGVGMNIDGGEGNDVIWGSDANETISGGSGNDTIFGGIGADVLTGGAGADVFEFTRTSIDTSVTDFDAGEGDALRFYNTGGAEFDASSVALTGNGMTISYTDTASGTAHEISISLAESAADFTATLLEMQNALEIV